MSDNFIHYSITELQLGLLIVLAITALTLLNKALKLIKKNRRSLNG